MPPTNPNYNYKKPGKESTPTYQDYLTKAVKCGTIKKEELSHYSQQLIDKALQDGKS